MTARGAGTARPLPRQNLTTLARRVDLLDLPAVGALLAWHLAAAA